MRLKEELRTSIEVYIFETIKKYGCTNKRAQEVLCHTLETMFISEQIKDQIDFLITRNGATKEANNAS